MPAGAPCKICDTRRARRYCPGVSGEICPICCGTGREVTVSCPLECPYLQEARRREKLPEVAPGDIPNGDIRVSEDFLRKNESLLIFVAAGLAKASLETAGAVDSDARDSLSSLVRTYRTLQTGLYYDSRPENTIAARIYDRVQDTINELRKAAEAAGAPIRDTDVLGIIVFLERLYIQHTNSRPKGRAFIDFLRQFFPPPSPVTQERSSLLQHP